MTKTMVSMELSQFRANTSALADMYFKSVLVHQQELPCLDCNLPAVLQLNDSLPLPSDALLVERDLIFDQSKVVEEPVSFHHRQAVPLIPTLSKTSYAPRRATY